MHSEISRSEVIIRKIVKLLFVSSAAVCIYVCMYALFVCMYMYVCECMYV